MSQADFSKLFEAPLQRQLEPLKENSGASQREMLSAAEPGILYRKLAEGARQAKSAHAAYLSSETHGLLDACLAKAKLECEQIKPLWAQLDHYDRNGVWEGMKAGYEGGEAQVGAAIGGWLLGGLGAVIGGALGGWVSGSRVDENFQKGMQDYGNWLTHWGEELDAELQNRILPSVHRDLARPISPAMGDRQLPAASRPNRSSRRNFGRAVIGLVLLTGFSVAGWYYYQRHEAQKQAGLARPPVAPTAPLDALQGKWLSDSNRGYDVVLVGDTLEFRVHSALDQQRDGYRSGEMHFRLRRHNGTDTGFMVEQKVRPILPAALKYGKESLDSCQELMTHVDAQPLRAQLVDDRLSIDMAKVHATTEILDAKRGLVLHCKNLQQAKNSRIQISLTRLPPGKEFPATEKLVHTRKTVPKSTVERAASPPVLPLDGDRPAALPSPEAGALEKTETAHGVGGAE